VRPWSKPSLNLGLFIFFIFIKRGGQLIRLSKSVIYHDLTLPASQKVLCSSVSEWRARLSMKRKSDTKYEACAHICALDREICQVRKHGELRYQTVEEDFSLFC
jgi:hypothetical protein